MFKIYNFMVRWWYEVTIDIISNLQYDWNCFLDLKWKDILSLNKIVKLVQ